MIRGQWESAAGKKHGPKLLPLPQTLMHPYGNTEKRPSKLSGQLPAELSTEGHTLKSSLTKESFLRMFPLLFWKQTGVGAAELKQPWPHNSLKSVQDAAISQWLPLLLAGAAGLNEGQLCRSRCIQQPHCWPKVRLHHLRWEVPCGHWDFQRELGSCSLLGAGETHLRRQ